MGQSQVAPGPSRARPIPSVSLECIDRHPAGPLIVRARDADDANRIGELSADRIAWIEAPLAISSAPWPPEIGLDVILRDPANEAAKLYSLLPLREDRPLRVTIPAVTGVKRAARIAMALQLPVRLMMQQPPARTVEELHSVLDGYLHDPQTTASVQPFDSALAFWLHGNPATAWMALDLDPAHVQREPGSHDTPAIPDDPDFVSAHIARLIEEGSECATCPFAGWCAGFFKWPDTVYACDTVKPLLETIADSAAQIAKDVDEAKMLQP